MGDMGPGGTPACGLDKDGNDRTGIPDHPWIGYRFRYLLLAFEEAPTLSDFHHQPDYSAGGDTCGVAGRRTHPSADADCGDCGAGFGMVSVAGGRANRTGRR